MTVTRHLNSCLTTIYIDIVNIFHYTFTMKSYYVYIATNYNNTVLYTGVTNNIDRRLFEHKNKIHPKSFTAKYNINKLVYAESARYAYDAISRE